MLKISLWALGAAAVAAGCTFQPEYGRPVAPVAQSWPGSVGPATTASTSPATNAAAIGWRDFFTDPRLQKLIELSLANNRDYRVAMLNVQDLEAQYRLQRAALLPNISGYVANNRSRVPGNTSGFTTAYTANQYSLSLGMASYEIDFFGRIRSLKASALERYFATAETRRTAQIALVSAVANQYLATLEYEEALVVARQTLETVQKSYDLNKRSFELGKISELDVRTAEAQVQRSRSDAAAFSQLLATAQNALTVLVGQPLPADLPPVRPLAAQGILAEVPVGLPSEVLQQRPDVLSAEHQLKAANANIGAARAAFFPSITLTGSIGTSSSELSGLFGPGTAAWNFSPQIKVPLFEVASNRATLDSAEVRKKVQVANYEKAIQTAFREVADTLAGKGNLTEQLAAQQSLVEAQAGRFKLADLRYRNGIDSYLTVLLAQTDLTAAQQSLLQARLAVLANEISLYKALGGGWVERTGEPVTVDAK
ncbi:MAG TPA: efflux transporter outer membrane subunit [Candidatus Limnocylindria bacterium]|nr:efflux transporter outer membrane subunit [Candidatus Limnocylindria bacterium]